MKRRDFLRRAGAGAAGGLLLPGWARGSELGVAWEPEVGGRATFDPVPDGTRIVILHTNDTHSRMDPFPMDGGPFQGLGGVARRSTLVEGIRAEHANVLLLDSGDIFQGTPYFNFFKGEIEIRAMSTLRYDVATIGNHDFDNGVTGLVDMMSFAEFDFVSANYDVSDSPLAGRVKPWLVRDVGGVGVGVFGLGIAFEGLVLESLHQGVLYTDPFAAARAAVEELRGQGCALIICLSHLGYRYRDGRPSDTLLAQQVEGIDLILGGHTHTFMDQPDVHPHADGSRTVVNQVGWGGMRLGRIDVSLGPPQGAPAAGGRTWAPRHWGWTSYPVDASLD